MVYDIVIIGSGVSGLAAAIYAGRFRMKTLVLGDLPGGVITTTNIVENYPGFKKLTGMELAEKIKEHALDYKDVEIKNEKVTKIEKKGDKSCFLMETEGKQTFEGKTIIFATGTEYKKLGIPGEKKFANKGVHYCASCDGFAYKNKIIGVVGGSDTAAKEALFLAEHGKEVYIIYRKEKIRAEPVNIVRVEQNKKIKIINNTNVAEIKGDKFVTGVVFDKEFRGSKEFKLDGVFIAIGHVALSGLAKDLGVNVNGKGEIIIDKESKTNVPGIFAAGDVVDTKFKQAITGVAEGVTAAYSAFQYIGKENVVSPV